MKNKLKLGILLGALSSFSFGQGCSDAGFCTLDEFKPGNDKHTNKNQFKAGAFFGGADHDIAVYGNYLEYSRRLNDKLVLSSKITTLGQNGNDISSFGVSDLFLNANYSLTQKANITLGSKIPLSTANKQNDGVALPMDYQSSLGTFDLIVGVGFSIDKFQFVTAIQQPLTNNKNEFVTPSSGALTDFQTTNEFERAGDVLVRVSYPLQINEKIRLTPSILPIYHLSEDRYRNTTGEIVSIKGSQGLTLNGNVYLDYRLNNRSSLQLNLATPFIIRDARPDGLTRTFVANLEYKINF